MASMLSKWPAQSCVGLAGGAVLVYVDCFAFEGEVSPIIIVALLLAATAMAGAMWGRSGWIAAAVTWVCLPLTHLVKHVLDLPDTLHPNTYTSILFLAAVHAGDRNRRHGLRSSGPQACDRPAQARSGTCLTTQYHGGTIFRTDR